MTLDDVLSRLQGVRQSGNQQWQALCPAHDDRQASLSITEKDGKVLLHCHAGCTTKSVVEALGLSMKNLFSKPKTDSNDGWPKIIATYDYTDETGKLLYQAVRYEPKSFKQRRPDGNDGWTWNLQGVTRVLYRLPKVLEAVRRGEVIFITEGEKDVHSLESIGLTATCNSGGAGKWHGEWQDSYSQTLKGAEVVILPDNDDAGHKHAQKVAQSLQGLAASIKVVELPGLSEKGDVSDWIAAGHTREELLRLVDSVEEWTPPCEEETPRATGDFPLTDLGNAERLIHAHGEDLRYVPDWKKWLIWNDIHWNVDRSLKIERLAKETVRRIYGEAEAVQDSQKRRDIAQWAMKSESSERIAAMIRLAQSEVAIMADRLDLDPYLLCCQNGVLDLRTGELLTPRRENYITKQVAIAYHPQAECPTWDKFLEQVLPDSDARSYVQKAVGYSLTGDVSERCLFFLYGEGKNGKSTLVEQISELMGNYFAKIPSEAVMLKQNTDSKREAVALIGKRLISTSEVTKGQKLHEGFIKDMTGGDTLAAKPLYGEQLNFKSGFKLWMYGNYRPTIRGKDEAIWDRIRLIPFTVRIAEQDCDKHLSDKLRHELPGILRWAVEGCLLWQKEGLNEPEAVLDAVNEYRHEQDGLADFLAEYCIFDRKATITKKELWSVYREWIAIAGEEGYESQRMFNDEIRGRPGIKEGRGTGNVAVWKGIALRTSPDSSDNLRSKVIGVTKVIENPVTFFSDSSYRDFTQKSVTSVTKVTLEHEKRDIPTTPCLECSSSNDWYFEPLARNGKGGWVCQACHHVHQEVYIPP